MPNPIVVYDAVQALRAGTLKIRRARIQRSNRCDFERKIAADLDALGLEPADVMRVMEALKVDAITAGLLLEYKDERALAALTNDDG